jgi:UPF0755 protein
VTARIAAYLTVAALLGGFTTTAWFFELLEPMLDEAPEKLFEVHRGDSLRAVAERLEREGFIRDARAASLWGRWRGQETGLHAGEYWISAAFSPAEILDRIAKGRIAAWAVSIPEGLTAEETGARIADAGLVDPAEFAAAVSDVELVRSLGIEADSLEGYLFPETYRLPHGLSGAEVARVLVEQFQRAWSEVAEGAEERGLSMHEVVTLASIVEKETGAAEERPLIASVFANRLRRNMRLESDPTVIYGIPDFDGNLRRRDLDNEENPYNTYRHFGLTPGPIANPGLDSLRAVVAPAETDFLFFVSRNDGTHHFSPTYREHVNAVDRYQRARARR